MKFIRDHFPDSNDEQIRQLDLLFDLYLDWNEYITVISEEDLRGFYENYIFYSLAIATAVPLSPGEQILDLGTSSGFPTIPLAIMFPDVQFMLVNRDVNRIKVAEAIVEEIGLTNVRTMHGRVEDIHNQRFHYVVSKAEAPLKVLMTRSKPLLRIRKRKVTVKKTGILPGIYFAPGLICLKSGDLEHEIRETNTRPFVMKLNDYFNTYFFREQQMVYVSRRSFGN